MTNDELAAIVSQSPNCATCSRLIWMRNRNVLQCEDREAPVTDIYDVCDQYSAEDDIGVVYVMLLAQAKYAAGRKAWLSIDDAQLREYAQQYFGTAHK